MSYKRYWLALAVVILGSFAVLGTVGRKMISQAPPIPDVYSPDGQLLFTGAQITDGQGVWQSIGGQEIGTVWGHGAYVAPDWSADWLHRESEILLDTWAQRKGAANFAALSLEEQAGLKARLVREERTNTYDAAQNRVVISADRAAAFNKLAPYYADVFATGRKEYAIPQGALVDQAKQHQLAAFFWWSAWATTTERPGSDVSYTNNWPHEPLVGNNPTSGAVLWSMISVICLIAGVGGLVWWNSSREKEHVSGPYPTRDPFLGAKPTPSQRATIKYFVVVVILWGVQILMGVITAHYGVEGRGFYGFPLDKFLPYAITRTWHLQIAIFWIATSWLATGLYVGPAVSGHEPKFQRLGVNVLFGALVLVVGGSLAGEWMGIQQKLGNAWFWLGSQGYEYVDLGRLWQILLFVGLVLWLVLMVRSLKPAFTKNSEDKSLLSLFLVSSIAIPTFYAAGLMYGQRSHLVTAEYWRWWVVHLWVEGFFEVFATVVIAFLFTRLKLLEIRSATKAVMFSTIIFLSGGIIGTFHHLYFAGSGAAVIALGAVFSALEVAPLTLIGYEAWENLRLAKPTEKAPWVANYKWPIYFFVAVAFWNLVGAGVFGFLINPPVALYYMQGLNLTPVHGHTALFGVYGMLGLGLTLFCLRVLQPGRKWKEGVLKYSFWSINLGLIFMVVLSMFPIGILQAEASIKYGTWYARSAEFMQSGPMQVLRWMRVPGDVLFAVGAALLGWFVLGLLTGHSYEPESRKAAEDREAVLTAL
ncbi:nitric-oxide reductase large subunit [Occallatibacter riparius]|uniref:Nitric-oxide reductase large subunit n=1 Tax=Occallatibacter riparius TaxID=1002689 RepID=A0A9J7BV87_9BACT|nr:nitric-oxide reductase large subunit [Occallatibacter riparius]UWZ84822.1 nitric-oxide reductase large subunit [Occallatibacter riparius]